MPRHLTHRVQHGGVGDPASRGRKLPLDHLFAGCGKIDLVGARVAAKRRQTPCKEHERDTKRHTNGPFHRDFDFAIRRPPTHSFMIEG